MKIRPVGAVLVRVDGRTDRETDRQTDTDRHDKANSRVSQFCDGA
jgi:hypothetical protein